MKARVLFLCVHNSARSQLAEGLLRKLAGDAVEVFSAGSEPSHVNPYAGQVLRERGVDASSHTSKNVSHFVGQPFDYVITLCDEEVCPVFPGAVTHLHWGMPDPSTASGDGDTKLEAFRRTADAIETHLHEFMQKLVAPERY